MELDVTPEHLVIVGGSYVGLEFGQIFRRFGSAVTIVEMASRLVQLPVSASTRQCDCGDPRTA
jgi:pyruvate/2-oxoglutarate dehydrogenase complex dihydrolipoamide dehydrogenase (E3) component